MSEISGKLKRGEISISDAIVKTLPELRGRVPDETLIWLASELQGYSNSVQFYQNNAHGLPTHRVVKGKLKLMDSSGKLSDLQHTYASKGQYFLGAPVAWLEESANMPGEIVLVELPDLTSLISAGRGNVACECAKDQLKLVLSIVRGRVLEVMNLIPSGN